MARRAVVERVVHASSAGVRDIYSMGVPHLSPSFGLMTERRAFVIHITNAGSERSQPKEQAN